MIPNSKQGQLLHLLRQFLNTFISDSSDDDIFLEVTNFVQPTTVDREQSKRAIIIFLPSLILTELVST